METKGLALASRRVRKMETQYLEIVKLWIRKIFDLQKLQFRAIMRK